MLWIENFRKVFWDETRLDMSIFCALRIIPFLYIQFKTIKSIPVVSISPGIKRGGEREERFEHVVPEVGHCFTPDISWVRFSDEFLSRGNHLPT